MSQAEIQRFFSDMTNDAGLVDAARAVVQQPADLVAFATARGYAVEMADVEQAMRAGAAGGDALSDDQLGAVAGGTSGLTAFEIIRKYLLGG